MIEGILKKALTTREYLNELYVEVREGDFKDACLFFSKKKHALLRLMFAADEREVNGVFKVYCVFSVPGIDRFFIVATPLREDDPVFSSITRDIPAAHWYEREIQDMFGLTPKGHPDPRRLVFHDSFPAHAYPLRKGWKGTETELREWGEGAAQKVPYTFMEIEGEGICEIPVGPVHAGIIEPGHFRFNVVGETIFFLEPRLFYTYKGTEKHFEDFSFFDGVRLAERVSGTSSFSHSSAYCMAVERMARIAITEKAMAVRTLLLEIERLYNHIGDIGNICAGTGLAVGYAKGAVIKENLMQLNQRITGNRFLRGINCIGGVKKDVLLHADDLLHTADAITRDYKALMRLLLGTVSHVDRLENTGRLSRDIAMKLGVTGIAARASGINDDMRKAHPHLLYGRLDFEPHTMARGDVYARMMVRAAEAECSLAMINELLEKRYQGELAVETADMPAYSSALGYTETPRGSVFYWIMSDKDGRPLRVKLRSPSYCNWPAVPFAVHGNIVPDFPLCNKSFNLSYSGCDM
ncbi:MAG TPA: NADH-quinone oxidoreductase subunit F [Nitrospiraceae bacterium]|jgi:Ni,Fe-hydrogenase III large subunit/Ni,Fe-hydrogenase III component G|nr:NADH-quinone oxidoreductase subunit F [Nitrospiraceae bacterium]